MTKNEQYLVNLKYLGPEPDLSGNITDIDYAVALNWYNSMATVDEGREYLSDYLYSIGRFEESKKVSKIPDNWISTTTCWIARMVLRGVIFKKSIKDFFEKKLTESFDKIPKPKKKEIVEENKPSIQERMRDRCNMLIAELEDKLASGETFSVYEWMKAKEVPSVYTENFIRKFAPYLSELIELTEVRKMKKRDDKQEQLVEYYQRWSNKFITDEIFKINNLLEDIERYGSNEKKARKPSVRKKKEVPADKKIKNLKYQKEDNSLKLVSINPEKIIGSQELWTYNTKYKTLTVLKALDRGGLQVKGTSIINYDETNSVTKLTGRKSEAILDKVLKGGKIVLRKLLEELKNASSVAYRLNENTILLKVVNG
ncbi:hypothetical protein UFOVP787_94 [uncultured Caudovirales phage]|uniref:Uncharacterized protein n=1 Tax=uncultured Caudovirales phage TaxID=2100421 RepID=A0A6J5P0K3_9CAUD|nr:hypothetical protein UFOVP787_94 [uncultured Caudovirales phage]